MNVTITDHVLCVCSHHAHRHAYVPPSCPHPGWGVGACDQCSCPHFICKVCLEENIKEQKHLLGFGKEVKT